MRPQHLPLSLDSVNIATVYRSAAAFYFKSLLYILRTLRFTHVDGFIGAFEVVETKTV